MTKTKTGFFHLAMTKRERDALNEATPHVAREIVKTLEGIDYTSINFEELNDSLYLTIDCPRTTLNRYLDNITPAQRKFFMRFLIELTLHRLKNKSPQPLDKIRI